MDFGTAVASTATGLQMPETSAPSKLRIPAHSEALGAIGTVAMGEHRVGMLGDVRIDLMPVILVVPYLLATRTDGQ